MNNAEYFCSRHTRTSPSAAYDRYLKTKGIDGIDHSDVASAFSWLMRDADCALDFAIGDIVQISPNCTRYDYLRGKFGVVENYGSCFCPARNLDQVSVRFPHSYLNIAVTDLVSAEIPSEMLALAQSKLTAKFASNCPLKDEGACMKGGDDE